MDRCSDALVHALLDRELSPHETVEEFRHMTRCEQCFTEYDEAKKFRAWFREQVVPVAAPRDLADHVRLRLESEEKTMFVIKLNGQPAAITNTFDSAVSYVEGLQCPPRAVTITTLNGHDFVPAVMAIQQGNAAAMDLGSVDREFPQHEWRALRSVR
jgi:hypothetical protein